MTSLDAELKTFIQDVKRAGSSHAKKIIHDIMPRFFGLASKLKGKNDKDFALPDGQSFTTEAALFQAICPSLGRSSFFDYKKLWANKDSEPTRKYLCGKLSKKEAVKELSDLGLVKNTGKRKGAGGGGEGETKKQKCCCGGGDGVPIEVVVELLRLYGATVDKGELETADAIGRYLKRLRVERGGAQGQGQQEEKGEGSGDDDSDND